MRVRRSSIDMKIDALAAKKLAKGAKKPKGPPKPVTNLRGMARYGKHPEFQDAIAAVERDIARLLPELRRLRRKRRSLLAVQRQRCRYESVNEFRESEQKRMKLAQRDRFDTSDPYR